MYGIIQVAYGRWTSYVLGNQRRVSQGLHLLGFLRPHDLLHVVGVDLW